MTEKEILKILYEDLYSYISPKVSGTIYSVCDIIALAYRESGSTIAKRWTDNMKWEDKLSIYNNFMGDSGHGHSIYQIDDRSYLPWIKTGAWRCLNEATAKCIEVLKEKQRFLEAKGYNIRSLGYTDFKMCVFCAYNTGQGNVYKALKRGKDPNDYTAHKNYGREVVRLSRIVDEMSQARAVNGENKISEKEFKQGTKS